jgi:hypothetical protein
MSPCQTAVSEVPAAWVFSIAGAAGSAQHVLLAQAGLGILLAASCCPSKYGSNTRFNADISAAAHLLLGLAYIL